MQTFPKLYNSGLQCFRETLRLDGVRGLYAGWFLFLVPRVPVNLFVEQNAYGFFMNLNSVRRKIDA